MHSGIILGIALKLTIGLSVQARDDSLRLLRRPTYAEAGHCIDLPDTVKAGTSRMSELAIGTPQGARGGFVLKRTAGDARQAY